MPERRPLRDRIRFFWKFSVVWPLRIRWFKTFAPYKLQSETLYGYDGEPPHFVRADLAGSPQEAAEYLAHDYEMTVEEYGRGMEPVEKIHRVWMVEVEQCPATFTEDGCENDECDLSHEEGGWMHTVPSYVDGAVRYWKWDG